MIYDVIIVGAGPAGMSASLYTSRAGLSTLMLDKNPSAGGQLLDTETVENYLGAKDKDAFDLADQMYKDAMSYGAVHHTLKVDVLKRVGNHFIVGNDDKTYESRSVILATGTNHNQHPADHGHLHGKGVSYCAVCDALFFKNKNVSVIGSGDSAFESAQILSTVADKVYLIARNNNFKAKPYLIDSIKELDNVEILSPFSVDKINGNNEVESITVSENTTGSEFNIEVSGVFPNIGSTPDYSYLINASELMNDGNYITPVNRDLSISKGIYMIGDMIHSTNRQIAIAVGEGALVGLEVYSYIKKIEQGV